MAGRGGYTLPVVTYVPRPGQGRGAGPAVPAVPKGPLLPMVPQRPTRIPRIPVIPRIPGAIGIPGGLRVPVVPLRPASPVRSYRVQTPPPPPKPMSPPPGECCICSDAVPHRSIMQCSHPVCMECSKMLQTLDCPTCRQPLIGPYLTPDIRATIVQRAGAAHNLEQIADEVRAHLADRMPWVPSEVLYDLFLEIQSGGADQYVHEQLLRHPGTNEITLYNEWAERQFRDRPEQATTDRDREKAERKRAANVYGRRKTRLNPDVPPENFWPEYMAIYNGEADEYVAERLREDPGVNVDTMYEQYIDRVWRLRQR